MLRPLPQGGSHYTSLTVFSGRAQSPELRLPARDWGGGVWGSSGGEKPLGSSPFYLPTWRVPPGLGKAPTLTSPAPLLELWDWATPAPGRDSKAGGATGGFTVQ